MQANMSTGRTQPEMDSIMLWLNMEAGTVSLAVMPTAQVRSIDHISWRPVSLLEKSPQMDGMYSGHIIIVRSVTTTFSAPPANGISIDSPMITSPNTMVKIRPTFMSCFSSAFLFFSLCFQMSYV